VLIKICGLTGEDDARAAIDAGAHLLGFVFVPGTPRAVDPDAAGWIRDLPVATVGVFRDAPLGEVQRIRDDLRLDWVQLHGDEPDDWLRILGGRVIRRMAVSEPFDWERLSWLATRCLPLVDPGAGDGRAFDWSMLGPPPNGSRFGLAGGLTPANVGDAVRALRPTLVDVSSGVESAPGVKDHEAVRAFVAAARGGAMGAVPGAVSARS
jgi:phosphoribosylanthranilate isomerase